MFNLFNKVVVEKYTFSEVEKLVKESNQEISNIEIVDVQEDFFPKQVCLKIEYNESDEFIKIWVDYEENNGEKVFLKYVINKIKEYSVFKRKEKYELMKIVKEVLPEASIEINLGKDGNDYTIEVISKELKSRFIFIYILNNYLISIKSGKSNETFYTQEVIRPKKSLLFSEESLKELVDYLNK